MPQSSPPGSTLKRKQPTISSFFTKKAPASQEPPSDATDSQNTNSKKKDASGTDSGVVKSGQRLSNGNSRNGKVAPASKRARTGSSPAEEDTSASRSSPLEISQGGRSLSSSDSQRTNRFRFGGLSIPDGRSDAEEENMQEDDREKARREKLHHRFVIKLGGPDCLIGIENNSNTADGAVGEYGEVASDGSDADEETAKGKAKPASRKGARKLTPMEKQVIDIKRKHKDTVLVVEVGYKFRFFGEDARVAAKELSIVCIPGKLRFDERTKWTFIRDISA